MSQEPRSLIKVDVDPIHTDEQDLFQHLQHYEQGKTQKDLAADAASDLAHEHDSTQAPFFMQLEQRTSQHLLRVVPAASRVRCALVRRIMPALFRLSF